ncbi:MAG: TerB family tellurite resistance protein [Cyclobacteriaceae bacterium]|nr:TerB family tellurite resistance protein [Cyclobacteriaceae bacterium]UYN85267.1 MAG: TerB family tellurite resistance protein [Cyclobacteriaceae bacterium]
MVIHKNFADFVLFLYIYMAHADGEFHEAEREVIKEKMKRLYPEDVDFNKKLNEELNLFDDFDKNQLKTLFRDTFNHFSSIKFPQKYKVFTDMYDIINADGKVDESETKALNALKEIIDISN